MDRQSFGVDRVGSVRIRFRAGRVPEEFWWRVQVHIGMPAPHAGGAGATRAGGETEDFLHSRPSGPRRWGDTGAFVRARCDGVDPKGLTVAPAGPALIVEVSRFDWVVGCTPSEDRRSVSCLMPRVLSPNGAKGKEMILELHTDRFFVRFTIFIKAGGASGGGTTHVLRQDWWVTKGGVSLCSQTTPRTERQRCATINTKPKLVDEGP